MKFIGRKEEIETLKKLYESNGLKGAILYGRCRTGKTSLLLESAKEFKGKVIYYQCLDTIDGINAENLLSCIKNQFPEITFFGKPQFTDILSLIFSIAEKQNILFILDEYSYLKDQDLIDSYLQSLIDHNQGLNLKIILSGSYVSIRKHLLDYDSPLHGRFLYSIQLEPFDYYESSYFYPQASLKDKVRYYSAFGGIPYHLSLIRPVLFRRKPENTPFIQERSFRTENRNHHRR